MEVWQLNKAISGSTLPVKERRADRDAGLALDRHPIRARPPPVAARLDLSHELGRKFRDFETHHF
jgi:hypothetical protein